MLNFLDGWSVGKVVPAVAVELGDSYSVGACIISWHNLVQLCGGDPSPLRGMNFTTRPRSPDLGNASYREDRFSGLGRRNLAASHTFRESRFSRVESNGSERICPSPYQACLLAWEDARILFRYMPAFKRRNWGRFVGAVQEPPSGTSMRIIPSCLEVRKCRSHRTTVLPIFFSIRSRNDTSTRLPLASRT